MTFYIGLALGFGIGGCVLFIVVMYMMSVIMKGQKSTNVELFKYWEVSMDNQKQQLLILSDMATSLSPPPTIYSVDTDEEGDK